MLGKNYSKFSIRRRRQSLLRFIIIIFLICLFIQIKYNTFYSSSSSSSSSSSNTETSVKIIKHTNVLPNKVILNCSGDPAKQYCENEVKLCDPYLIVYNKLFAVTRSVILRPEYAKGKRTGGEDIKDVLNQSEQDEYFHFEKSFITLPCDNFQHDGKLPEGHIAEILSLLITNKTSSTGQIIDETTIAIRRQDYVNFYHTMTDIYTVYLLCRFFNQDPKNVRILFVDAHPKGNLDILWSQLFHSYTRLGYLKNISSIFYRELIWAQPQQHSELDLQRNRRTSPSFFSNFHQHILKQFNAYDETNQQVNCQFLNIFFLVRHNYVAHPRNPSGKITRQLSNEKEVLNDLKTRFASYKNINFSSNHFEELSFEEQLNMVRKADIFIGIHGAGLTHVLFMKEKRVLIELVGSTQTGQHFDLMASINNVNYHRCVIADGLPTTSQDIYNCIMKKLLEICPTVTDSQKVETTTRLVENTFNISIKS